MEVVFAILNSLTLVVAILYVILIFYKRDTKINKITRLVLQSVFLTIYAIKIPIEIMLNQSYIMSSICAGLWLTCMIMMLIDLISNRRKVTA